MKDSKNLFLEKETSFPYAIFYFFQNFPWFITFTCFFILLHYYHFFNLGTTRFSVSVGCNFLFIVLYCISIFLDIYIYIYIYIYTKQVLQETFPYQDQITLKNRGLRGEWYPVLNSL